ncbi:MAG: isoprenylcysteine carboxylmethyltransferase family protein [Mariprofundus sp.]
MWVKVSASTTIDPRYPHKTTTIVDNGIYAFTRNPMYLGSVLILTSLTVWLGTVFGVLVIGLFIFYMTRFQINPEEEMLTAQFGEAYLNYKATVRRWI